MRPHFMRYVVFVALLALAGCGSDDEDSTTQQTEDVGESADTGVSGDDSGTEPGPITLDDAVVFSDWAAVLGSYGRAFCFDYRGLLDDTVMLARMNRAIEVFATISPTDLNTPEERLAYWINAYNVAMVWLVLENFEHYLVGTVLSPPNGEPTFRTRVFDVAGEKLALDDIEHGVLRLGIERIVEIDAALSEQLRKFGQEVYPSGTFDVRIHFAVNCASLGCPDLRTEPYVGARVDAQLEEQTVSFLNNPAKGASAMGVSALLQAFYPADFESLGGVAAYVMQYNPDANTEENIIYDWTLNQCP